MYVFRESFVCVFMKFCQEHLAFSSARLFRLSTSLAELCPELMITCLPQLKDLIKSVELRRGVGYDPGLRLVINFLKSDLKLGTGCFLSVDSHLIQSIDITPQKTIISIFHTVHSRFH
jgi:hypothetical protein